MLPDLGLSVDLTGFEVGEIDGVLADVRQKKSANPMMTLRPPQKSRSAGTVTSGC
jgi:hypothetical protein